MEKIIGYVVDGHHGIYAPQITARILALQNWSVEDQAILEAGPDHDEYWDAWDLCLRDCEVEGPNGERYRLAEDEGGVYLYELEGDEEQDCVEAFEAHLS